MTVGLCVDAVEIGLATHLRYIRPYGHTELQPKPQRGGSAPIKRLAIKYSIKIDS